MINSSQKMLIHIYKSAAALDDPSYRNLLREFAGVESSASPDMGNREFDRVISALERVLFDRVHSSLVPDPRPHRYIHDEFYWRHRCHGDGYITTRQSHRIESLWSALLPTLPSENQNLSYLRAIMSRATGKPNLGQAPLTFTQAACVIAALQDRNSHARKSIQEPVPF